MQAPGLFDIPDKRGKFGLVHNVGLGGAVVVSLLRRPEFYKPGGKDGRSRYDFSFLH
jgi:sterol carrier protein 2